MRILYVSQYYPPESGAPAARVSELAHHWVKAGHEVTVLTGFPNHPTGVVYMDYQKRFWRLFYREEMSGVDVIRTWLLPLPNRKPHERILNYTSFCLSAAVRGLFLPRPSVIIATSPQLLVGITGWWLGLVKRTPVIFEVRDIWPDAIVASGVSHKGSWLAKFLRGISCFLHRVSDQVVVVTSAYLKELVEKWSVPETKVTVIPNGVETELFTPDGDPRVDKEALALPEGFLVSYVGTVGFAHGLDSLLNAAQITKEIDSTVRYLIVGEGAERERLDQRIKQLDLTNVSLIAPLPREAIPSLLRASDVCLVLLRRSEVFTTVIPTKLLEFMSCARPVVVGVDGEARRIVDAAQAGIYVEPEDHLALANAVMELRNDPERASQMGRNGRSYVCKNLAREVTAARYLSLLEQVARQE